MTQQTAAAVRGDAWSRRDCLRWGGLGLGLGPGLGLDAAWGRPAWAGSALPPIHSCISVFFYGGPSHIDTWDMKPDAPTQIRGEFRPIATSVPGIRVAEHMPHLARAVDRLAIIRSVHHPMTNHNAAAFAALGGRPPARGDQELLADDRNDPPCLGSILSRTLSTSGGMPAFVALPHVMHNVVRLPGQGAGFLGSAHEPFQVVGNPDAPTFRVEGLALPDGMTADRLAARESLRSGPSRVQGSGEAPLGDLLTTDMENYHAQAVRLMLSEPIRRAFRIADEPPSVRERYGRSTLGQSLLLARRLVEAGVRYVAVHDHATNGQLANWDAHADVFPRHRDALIPPADRGLAALIGDLADRGLLESTLVAAGGEFGRTPRINSTAGRDHWPHCYSTVLAGGGIRGGQIHGASDRLGAYPDRDGVSPGDLAATVLWRFGIDPSDEIPDLAGRPFRLADGAPLRHLFGA